MLKPGYLSANPDHDHIWLYQSQDQTAFMDDVELNSWLTVWTREGNSVTSSPGKSRVSFDAPNGDSIAIAEVVYCSLAEIR